MKLYLINKNPIISKLVALSVAKLGIEIEESHEISLNRGAEIVLIDDECFEQELFDSYKRENPETKFGLFYAKSTERLEGFNEYIQKPFLPTDLVKILSKISGITPIDNSHAHKAENEDALDLGDESLEGLDEELDLSGFDDLQLDDDEVGAGDAQLDFGAEESEEGIEEAVDSGDEQLDFGAAEGIEEAAQTAGDEQLDFGAEDSEDLQEESQDLNVLDKGDVEEIKDLLSDEDSKEESKEEALDLGKEFDVGDDSSAGDDLDFGDLTAELDKIGAEEENEESSEDLQLENLEVEDDIRANSADFATTEGTEDFDFGDLDLGETENQESKDSLEMKESLEEEATEPNLAQDSQPAESDMDLESLTNDLDLGGDLGDVGLDNLAEAQDLGDSDSNLESNDLGNLGDLADFGGEAESSEISDESSNGLEDLKDLDLGDLSSEGKSIGEEAVETANADLDSLGDLGDSQDLGEAQESEESEDAQELDLGEIVDSSDLGEESPISEVAFDEDLGESQVESELSDATQAESLESDLDLGEDLGTESAEVEALESSQPNEPSESTLGGLDDFDSLSAEGMSEALGEPIVKAPNPAPIVPNDQSNSDSALPSNIQANSLESLISVLQGLQAQNLKDLLSGATININIQFPKKD
ncbi:hypothetical protein [Helicobacter sp. MIT 05-5294]|uniref:hypothetical protein n=1 Tax=Helicobacter sp. MIT 05-5294 TaxID=1548150 RepID=UPI001EE860C3|nr:hypothetical protein [Helicobacter sp. MIT 05-5294]